jgi:hypothetical protein
MVSAVAACVVEVKVAALALELLTALVIGVVVVVLVGVAVVVLGVSAHTLNVDETPGGAPIEAMIEDSA